MLHTRNRIEYDPAECVGCGLCYKACFIDVIRWDAEKKQPVFAYVEDCAHCNYCMVSCRKGCIRVIPDYAAQSCRQSFDMYRKPAAGGWEET